MREQLQDMFAQMVWANHRILKLLHSTKTDTARALELFAHLLVAEKVWLMRILGEDSTGVTLWPSWTLSECETCCHVNQEGYHRLFDEINVADPGQKAVYQNSKGIQFETPVYEILTHVALHGNYHRGQIALVIRNGGGEPVNTDYITYVREKND